MACLAVAYDAAPATAFSDSVDPTYRMEEPTPMEGSSSALSC
jgi:hypothetical protein